MTLLRRGRYWYWIIRDLAAKYTRAWGLGFVLGAALAVVLWLVSPRLYQLSFAPIERHGIVGEFSPSNLPLSIQQLLSHGLTTIQPDGSVVPDLAVSMEATDEGKTYIFHLQSDHVWHTGKPVTAFDINYNIKDVRLTPVNDTTLRVELAAPFSPFPALVSRPILQKGLIGFGPYKVTTIQLKGDSVQYLRIEPFIDKTLPIREYRFYKTEALAVLAYKLGEVDTLDDLTSPHDLRSWGTASVFAEIIHNRIVTLFFNMNDPLLREKNIRQALGYALPEFSSERARSPIQDTSWAYSDDVRDFQPDATAVKRLLQNSPIGTTSGELTISTFSQYLDTATKISESWNSYGIPNSVRVENVLPADYHVLLTTQEVPPDPDQYPLWHSTQQQTNITGYTNVKIDKLLEDGRTEQDVQKRKAIYDDFQKRLVDDAPALFLYYPSRYTVSRSK